MFWFSSTAYSIPPPFPCFCYRTFSINTAVYIHSSNRYLLITSSVPGIVLGSREKGELEKEGGHPFELHFSRKYDHLVSQMWKKVGSSVAGETQLL